MLQKTCNKQGSRAYNNKLHFMKKVLLLIAFLVTLVSYPQIQTEQASAAFTSIKKILAEKDFFSAREYFDEKPELFSVNEKLIVKAYLENAFNDPGASNMYCKKIANFSSLPDSLQLDLLRLRQENHGRLFEYDQAYEVTRQILDRYKGGMKPEEIADYENMQVIWKALSGQPKQIVKIKGTAKIKMSRDKAKLANLAVESVGNTIDFIFDTGANLSTVTRTTAEKFGMQILEGQIEVGAITGVKVMAVLAVCPEFHIGSITVKNAVFIVFPGDALSFPQIDYQINGIIGFPVIEALNEIQITQSDEFIVPENPTHSNARNMALDFLTPLIRINGEHYTFDTGATSTALYSKYFAKHKDAIEKDNSLADIKLGGAGGVLEKKAYKIDFTAAIDKTEVVLKGVEVYTEKLDENENEYGNIGQDLVRQFQKMTINFDEMFIRFD